MILESDRDQQIIDEIMKNEKIPNNYICNYSENKYINLSKFEQSRCPFVPININKKVFNYNNKPNSIIEKIAPDEEFKIITDIMVPGVLPNTYYISTYGRLYTMFYKKFVVPMDREGYYRVKLTCYDFGQKKYVEKSLNIHRLVMCAFQWFFGCNEYIVNHIDGDTHNNYILNLEWCTHIWNTWHKDNILNLPANKNRANLTLSTVINICKDFENGMHWREIMQKYNVSENIIHDIRYGHSFKYITKDYDFKINYSEKKE